MWHTGDRMIAGTLSAICSLTLVIDCLRLLCIDCKTHEIQSRARCKYKKCAVNHSNQLTINFDWTSGKRVNEIMSGGPGLTAQ